MLFTRAGLEQATRLAIAARHAARFRDAGMSSVADLGCGIGGDALGLAALGLRVAAVDADEVTAAIAAYNLAPFGDSVTVTHGTAEEFVDAAAAPIPGRRMPYGSILRGARPGTARRRGRAPRTGRRRSTGCSPSPRGCRPA